ncbi:MAG: Asp-tRNA(Asn)/Glu-tRNA(Gln) amidotransferase subunit GatB [Thermodesulfobacteria bacterium]|nr:Asp-tRNA(Asn)/Glu-tRNA(Gln) amidotransferase subunit GatB [Thermodesulfobacteriota bacterium]
MDFEAVIGLEVHVQLKTNSKIFCSCSTEFGAPPNTHTCPVCLGMPGVLPVLNRKAVEYAMKMALATNCTINKTNVFARKHYFYPDLPKGYQISQYELPLAEAGYIDVETEAGVRRIRINRIHMEDDAGKLIHDESRPVSYVDLNRTGTPLIEIVSEPDIRTPEEASSYLKKIRQIVRYLKISDGNMEEGSLRCDANISLRPRGQEKFGTKAELKNMNSFRHVQKALEYEIRRQTALLLDGKEIVQETRLYDASKGVTHSMRGKEEAHDYRYFPDPDLVPIKVDDEWLESVRKSLPELPDEKRQRFVTEYGLPDYDAQVLTDSIDLAEYFEQCVKLYPEAKKVSNWIMVELLKLLKKDEQDILHCNVTPKILAELLGLIDKGTISSKIAKKILEEIYDHGGSPSEIVEREGLAQVSDESELAAIVEQVVRDNPKEVEKYRAGKKKVMGFFVGQVMRQTKGKANPKMVNELLIKLLDKA